MRLRTAPLAAVLVLSLAAGLPADEAADSLWITSFNAAKAQAAESNLDILIDFTGSDWCGWCIKLHDEVFATERWKQAAPKNFVLLVLDYPRKTKLSEEQTAHNDALRKQFAVRGYPTVFLCDASGKPYARTGYKRGGAEAYLQHLDTLRDQKSQRDTLLEAANAAEGSIDALNNVIEKLAGWNVGFAYTELKEQAVELDADNSEGLRLRYATELHHFYRLKGEDEKAEAYFDIVCKIDAEAGKGLRLEAELDKTIATLRQGKWEQGLEQLKGLAATKPTGEAGQKVLYLLATAHARVGDKSVVADLLDEALALAPDSQLAPRIKKVRERFKAQNPEDPKR